jgi:hypothetical protein
MTGSLGLAREAGTSARAKMRPQGIPARKQDRIEFNFTVPPPDIREI